MNKHFITPGQLLEDAYTLAWQVFESGFRPDFIVGVWRGGTPVAIAVHELLHVLGVEADHTAVRTSSYAGMTRRDQAVEVEGVHYLIDRLADNAAILLVDDVHDTGLSLQQIMTELRRGSSAVNLDIRVATPYYKPSNNRRGCAPDYFLHQTREWLVFPHELVGLTVAEIAAHKPELASLLPQLASRLK